jgi:hypothetical protein
MDKRYQNVKTGEIKPLPPNVFKAVKKHWRPIEENEIRLNVIPHTTVPFPNLPVDAPSVITDNDFELIVDGRRIEDECAGDGSKIVAVAADKESLQIVYETLSSQKADKRWNEKKLIQKIEELKENNK